MKSSPSLNALPLAAEHPELQPLLVDSPTACQLLGGMSQRSLWSHTVPRGSIPSLRIGRRVLYSVDALREWVDANLERPTAGSLP